MSEPSVEPPSDEPHKNETVDTMLAGYEAFFASQQGRFATISQALRGAIAGHDTALSQLHQSLQDTSAPAWPTVAAYIESVRECAVLPLRGEMAMLELIEVSSQAWAEQTADAGSPWAGLSKKDQQQLSPLAPLWQAVANAFAQIEFGVSEWTRRTLDAASALDCGARPVAPALTQGTDAEQENNAATVASAFDAAIFDSTGEQLVQHLNAAQVILDGLTEAVLQPLAELLESRRKKLQAASGKDDTADAQPDSADKPADQVAQSWQSWFAQVNARIAMAAARLAAFSELANMHVAFINGLGLKGPGLWAVAAGAATEHLQELKAKAEQLYLELGESHDGRRAIRQATDLFREATSRLDKDYVAVANPTEAKRFVEECSSATLASIKRQAQELPEILVVHSLSENASTTVNPRAPAREVTLRPAALEAIDSTLVPAFAAMTRLVDAGIATLAEETANLRSVLHFHLGAATEELRDVYWTRSSQDARQQADDAARELSLAGLDRVIEALAQQQKRVDECLAGVSALLTDARKTMWLNIGSQVQAETTTQKLTLKTRSTLRGYLLDFNARMAQMVAALLRKSLRQLQVGRVKLRQAFRYGRKAVTGDSESVDKQTSIEAVASLSEIRARLPVVYRRLFSFYPLSDETLLAGRDRDLTWLGQQLVLWRRGRASAYVLSTTPGSGLTTFLNVARQTCLRGTNVTEVDIAQRVLNEKQLTGLLMEALSLEAGENPPQSLGELADRIMAAKATAVLQVCIVERLEHIFLRHIGGTDLLGRMLRFFSATDSRIFWIATVSDFAWQLLEKNEPLALGLVRYRKMTVYDRASVEEVIIKRHGRSGLPLVFDPPSVISPFFRRRLKQADSEEARQALLQEQYFNDLFAASGQNIMLALFYWHLSISCHSDPVSIQVHALPKLSFDFLTSLSMPEAFALKAFLEHATLTVEEYSRIADIPAEASQEIFESLGNSMIVELDANEYRNVANVEFERIEANRRYRVRPLLVQPVIRYLRTKNIVH